MRTCYLSLVECTAVTLDDQLWHALGLSSRTSGQEGIRNESQVWARTKWLIVIRIVWQCVSGSHDIVPFFDIRTINREHVCDYKPLYSAFSTIPRLSAFFYHLKPSFFG